MTQYFDKHGTDIHYGDRIRCDWTGVPCCSGEIEGSMTCSQPPEWYARRAVVLSRADGSPVFRYKGGEDVRVGDTYRYPGIAHDLSLPVSPAPSDEWAKCTLIRRADSPRELSSTALIAQRPELAPKDERPILGKDRNGREVRRGDRVRGPRTGIVFHVTMTDDADTTFYGDGWHCPMHVAELVTDAHGQCPDCEKLFDRPPRCGILYAGLDGTDCGKPRGHKGKHCFADRNAPNSLVEWDELDESDKPVVVLESVCRALAGPTMAERIAENYRKFHAAVKDEVAREPSFSVVTDRSETELMAFITVPLVGERRCAVPSDTALNYSAIAFEWVAALRRMVAEAAGARVLGKGEA